MTDVKRVERWVTFNGKEFETEAEAIAYLDELALTSRRDEIVHDIAKVMLQSTMFRTTSLDTQGCMIRKFLGALEEAGYEVIKK